MSKATKKKKLLKGAECTNTASGRLKPGALDEYVYQVALEFPRITQFDCLKRAITNADLDNDGYAATATKQQAQAIFERIRPRLVIAAQRIASDIKLLAMSRLKNMLEDEATVGSNLLGAITLSTKDLFPNVSIKKVQSKDELDTEINKLLKEQGINLNGKELH